MLPPLGVPHTVGGAGLATAPSRCYGPLACDGPSSVPLTPSCQVLGSLAPTERVTWLQFDLPMMKRGALLHWSLADNLIERQVAASTGSRY